MKVFLSCYVVLLVTLVGIPAQALEPLVLYDDFDEGSIAPTKWIRDGSGQLILSNRLLMFNRTWGDTESDSGSVADGSFLNFVDPAAVMAIEATIQIVAAKATGCASNPQTTGAWVELGGFFFNTGTPTPGSLVNDVPAAIRIARYSDSTDRKNILLLQALVWHCTTADCSDATTLVNQSLGSIPVEEEVRLLIQWDPDNDQFIFQRDDEPQVFFPYTVSDATSPSTQAKWLSVFNHVANCTTEPQPVGSMAAFFDDVFVNESAAP